MSNGWNMKHLTKLALSVAVLGAIPAQAQVTGLRTSPTQEETAPTREGRQTPARVSPVRAAGKSPTGEGLDGLKPETAGRIGGVNLEVSGGATAADPSGPGLNVASPPSLKPKFQAPWGCAERWPVSTYENHGPNQNSIDTVKRDADRKQIGQFLPVVASAPGRVVFDRTFATGAKEQERWVFIDHDNGWRTHYIHMEDDGDGLEIGRRIGMGEVLGKVSNTGVDVTVHLHYGQISKVRKSAEELAALPDSAWRDIYWDGDGLRQEYNGKMIETHKGNPDMWGKWGDADAEQIRSLNCANQQFIHWFNHGDSNILRYNPVSNAVRINTIDPDGSNNVQLYASGNWGTNWTHFVNFYSFSNQAHLLKYSFATGDVEFVRLSPANDGMTTVSEGTIYSGWTHWEKMRFGGGWATIAYDSIHGFLNVDKINALSSGFENLLKTSVRKGYTSLVPYEQGSKRYLLAYKSGNGRAFIYQISPDGDDKATIAQVSSFRPGRDWTHMELLQHKGRSLLLGYNSMDGSARVWDIDKDGAGISNGRDFDWSPGVTSLTTFYHDSNAYVLLYRLTDGHTQKIRLNNAASGFTVRSTEDWANGFR